MRQTFVGSLVARILFQPVEETLRLFFSRLLPSTHSPTPSARTSALRTLHTVLSIQTAAALLLLVFGPPYLPIALPLLLPQAYLATSAPRVLAAWIWYVPVLAVNGVLEAFLASVARPHELNSQSRCVLLLPRVPLQPADGAQLDGCVLRRVRRSCTHAIPPRLRRRFPRLRQHRQPRRAHRVLHSIHYALSSALHRPPAPQLRLRSILPPMPYILALAMARILITFSARRTHAGGARGCAGA